MSMIFLAHWLKILHLFVKSNLFLPALRVFYVERLSLALALGYTLFNWLVVIDDLLDALGDINYSGPPKLEDLLEIAHLSVIMFFWLAVSMVCSHNCYYPSSPSPIDMLLEMYNGGKDWVS